MKNRVKELRDAKHLTQTGLALKVGSTQQTISKIETDKSNHGMGIGLIEETALKYNGLMEITMNENIFCLSVLLYQN